MGGIKKNGAWKDYGRFGVNERRMETDRPVPIRRPRSRDDLYASILLHRQDARRDANRETLSVRAVAWEDDANDDGITDWNLRYRQKREESSGKP